MRGTQMVLLYENMCRAGMVWNEKRKMVKHIPHTSATLPLFLHGLRDASSGCSVGAWVRGCVGARVRVCAFGRDEESRGLHTVPRSL
jgi:hypothetical protein